jgi:putative flippase GtrA
LTRGDQPVPTLRELVTRVYARQSLRFLAVGAWNTGFGYVAFAALYYFFSPYVHYMVLQAASVVINVTNAFLCYKFIVFRTRGNYVREYLRFYAVYAVPIGLGFVMLPFAIEVLGMNAYVASAVIICLLAVFSYFGHKHFSFRAAPGAPPAP